MTYNAATWNMQGAGTTKGDSKWSTGIPGLAKKHDILALQEAGTHLPERAQLGFQHYPPNLQQGWEISQHDFFVGSRTRSQPHRLLWLYRPNATGILEVDRTNLAMLIAPDITITNVVVVPSPPLQPNQQDARPALGATVQKGNYPALTFYTIHAGQNGYNVYTLMRDIAATTNGSWAALGDFNRDPNPINVPPNLAPPPAGQWPPVICEPDYATRASGRRLDYMIRNNGAAHQEGKCSTEMSDHIAVSYCPIQ